MQTNIATLRHLEDLSWRRKGGLISQQRRKIDPDYYRSLGCVVANEFLKPLPSERLAEFVGIVLGDGGLTRSQLHITLNSEADKEYVGYVVDLVEDLFGYNPGVCKRKRKKAVVVVVTGVKFVDYLLEIGLLIGSKVRHQVDVPDWIKDNSKYSRMCLRGLLDTDGGIFRHKYSVRGKEYSYFKLCFSNLSQPLRFFVFDVLKNNGFNPKMFGKKHVWLYSEKETRSYLEVFGSSNKRLCDSFA